jgi:hypothetical protein
VITAVRRYPRATLAVAALWAAIIVGAPLLSHSGSLPAPGPVDALGAAAVTQPVPQAPTLAAPTTTADPTAGSAPRDDAHGARHPAAGAHHIATVPQPDTGAGAAAGASAANTPSGPPAGPYAYDPGPPPAGPGTYAVAPDTATPAPGPGQRRVIRVLPSMPPS